MMMHSDVCVFVSVWLPSCLFSWYISSAGVWGGGVLGAFPDVRNPEAGARRFKDTSFIFFFFSYECPPLSCFPIVFFARPAK